MGNLEVCSYNADKGMKYALHYWKSKGIPYNEKLFYVDSSDCTNFVSQCVWAAYGGWIEGYSPEMILENRRRIEENFRQVSGIWYGSKSHAGSNMWCNVENFHDYVTNKNKDKGSFASSFGNIDPYKINPADIRVGDVVQFMEKSYNQGHYGHSLYVVKEGDNFSDINVVCHTLDDYASLLYKLRGVVRMRVIRFSNGKFVRAIP